MTIGSGIAIAAMWIAVGAMGVVGVVYSSTVVVPIAFFAACATVYLGMCDD